MPLVVLPALPSRPPSAGQLCLPVGKDARCDLAADPPQLGTVVRSPRRCGTRPRFRTTRSWFPSAVVQRALRLLIAGTPPRSVDMRTGHALIRTRPRGPTPPKRSLVTPNKGPKRPQRMENIQGQSLKTCRHCFSTGSWNRCILVAG